MNARSPALIAALAAVIVLGQSLHAQLDFGKLNKVIDNAKSVGKVAKGVAGIGIEEERAIGGSVATEIVGAHGGLVRDETITRRVNLLGKGLAYYSSRPALPWRFGVLNSDAINGFSAPGGYVFITRGLYDLCGDDDDALAAALAHEIAHITERHALKIVGRAEFVSGATALASDRSSDVRKLQQDLRQFDLGIDQVVKTILENGFDPQTEYAADAHGRQLALTTGYAPGALRRLLTQLQQQKPDASRKVFSTHPPLADRIKRLPADAR
jgi:beta-barrel assembly-enhancing protease